MSTEENQSEKRINRRNQNREILYKLSLVNKLFVKNDFDKCISLLKDVLAMSPKNNRAYFMLGLIFEEKKEELKAYNFYLIASQLMKDNYKLWQKLYEISSKYNLLNDKLYFIQQLQRKFIRRDLTMEKLKLYRILKNKYKVLETMIELFYFDNVDFEIFEKIRKTTKHKIKITVCANQLIKYYKKNVNKCGEEFLMNIVRLQYDTGYLINTKNLIEEYLIKRDVYIPNDIRIIYIISVLVSTRKENSPEDVSMSVDSNREVKECVKKTESNNYNKEDTQNKEELFEEDLIAIKEELFEDKDCNIFQKFRMKYLKEEEEDCEILKYKNIQEDFKLIEKGNQIGDFNAFNNEQVSNTLRLNDLFKESTPGVKYINLDSLLEDELFWNVFVEYNEMKGLVEVLYSLNMEIEYIKLLKKLEGTKNNINGIKKNGDNAESLEEENVKRWKLLNDTCAKHSMRVLQDRSTTYRNTSRVQTSEDYYKFMEFVFVNLGNYYLSKEDYNSALIYYQKVLAINKDNNYIKAKLYEVYKHMGNHDLAYKFKTISTLINYIDDIGNRSNATIEKCNDNREIYYKSRDLFRENIDEYLKHTETLIKDFEEYLCGINNKRIKESRHRDKQIEKSFESQIYRQDQDSRIQLRNNIRHTSLCGLNSTEWSAVLLENIIANITKQNFKEATNLLRKSLNCGIFRKNTGIYWQFVFLSIKHAIFLNDLNLLSYCFKKAIYKFKNLNLANFYFYLINFFPDYSVKTSFIGLMLNIRRIYKRNKIFYKDRNKESNNPTTIFQNTDLSLLLNSFLVKSITSKSYRHINNIELDDNIKNRMLYNIILIMTYKSRTNENKNKMYMKGLEGLLSIYRELNQLHTNEVKDQDEEDTLISNDTKYLDEKNTKDNHTREITGRRYSVDNKCLDVEIKGCNYTEEDASIKKELYYNVSYNIGVSYHMLGYIGVAERYYLISLNSNNKELRRLARLSLLIIYRNTNKILYKQMYDEDIRDS